MAASGCTADNKDAVKDLKARVKVWHIFFLIQNEQEYEKLILILVFYL